MKKLILMVLAVMAVGTAVAETSFQKSKGTSQKPQAQAAAKVEEIQVW